jgi:hypothetical protein
MASIYRRMYVQTTKTHTHPHSHTHPYTHAHPHTHPIVDQHVGRDDEVKGARGGLKREGVKREKTTSGYIRTRWWLIFIHLPYKTKQPATSDQPTSQTIHPYNQIHPFPPFPSHTRTHIHTRTHTKQPHAYMRHELLRHVARGQFVVDVALRRPLDHAPRDVHAREMLCG